MNWKEHIVADPDILVGKPTIRGTRISVEFILDCLSSDWSCDEVLRNYPHLTREQVLAAISFAAEVFKNQRAAAIEKLSSSKQQRTRP